MNFILRALRRLFWIVCYLLPINNAKIVFMSYYGRDYSDNPKYIAEELIRRRKDLKYFWILSSKEDQNDLPAVFKVIKLNSFSYIYHMSTAKIWVDNARKYFCLKKKKQIYLQTWHGGFGLKKIEKDTEKTLAVDYIRMAMRDSQQCDLMLSNSRTLTQLYHDAFWYSGDVMERGLPRNDRLFNYTDADVKTIREKLNIDHDVKIILYAPTFRQDENLDVYNLDSASIANAAAERFGGKWLVLLRLHPNVFRLSVSLPILNDESTINVSFFSDIQELYMISDILITDYSSVMLDFMLLKKPCLIYASDMDSYRKERDFFIPLESLPFPLTEDNQTMVDSIISFDYEKYKKAVDDFYKLHGFCELGNAANAAAGWILDRMKDK